ncbi:MAG: isocitrate lyase/phosphoenolpyruvate mutase family protein [Planctomycetes bacterium]|nr:isocitrate lyase/phosphoenolpyruvate mutase family protein [Planctomycetota bacterium]
MTSWIAKKDLLVGMGARDALEARLIEEAGFDFVWSSSLGISASYAVPDASLVSMNQYLQAARSMREQIRIPVLADCDTGYGNERNAAYAVKLFEEAGIAGACFEDKSFPKENSLLPDGRQDLESMEDFARKIEAAVEARKSPGFAVVARVEALVAGWGMEEALKRSRTYEEAGADLILIHSRSTSPDEIEEFVRRWDGGIPLVLVPTLYPALTEKRIRALGKVRVVIYANQALRAAVRAQEELLAEIRRSGGIHTIESFMVPLNRIFEIQGAKRKAASTRGARACRLA